jgi:pyrimidine-nucleoside phosphorylase
MSGRGLGFTGGTVDKMEAIPGFRTSFESAEFIDLVNRTGLAVIGQTAHIATADKKLYALRDVTATVDNIGLITSSIMSKKLASGSDAILLDVKCGSGAFMETIEQASELGNWMVDIGKAAKKDTVAFITDMSQPLGLAVGNAVEIIEAIETLKNSGPADITALSLELAAYMVYLGKKAKSPEDGYRMVLDKLESGEALKKFAEFVDGQGGDPGIINNYSLFPKAEFSKEIIALSGGFVKEIEARKIGRASLHAGAGREKKEDTLDLAAGIILNKKVGDAVRQGDVLATLFAGNGQKLEDAYNIAKTAFSISAEAVEKPVLIKKVII